LFVPVGRAAVRNKIRKNPDYVVLGAKHLNKIIGTIMGVVIEDIIGDCRPFMVIENMIIDQDYRGKGIGKELMMYLENIARDRNCYYIIFVSSSKRKDAHRFYQSMGYELDLVQGFKKYL